MIILLVNCTDYFIIKKEVVSPKSSTMMGKTIGQPADSGDELKPEIVQGTKEVCVPDCWMSKVNIIVPPCSLFQLQALCPLVRLLIQIKKLLTVALLARESKYGGLLMKCKCDNHQICFLFEEMF